MGNYRGIATKGSVNSALVFMLKRERGQKRREQSLRKYKPGEAAKQKVLFEPPAYFSLLFITFYFYLFLSCLAHPPTYSSLNPSAIRYLPYLVLPDSKVKCARARPHTHTPCGSVPVSSIRGSPFRGQIRPLGLSRSKFLKMKRRNLKNSVVKWIVFLKPEGFLFAQNLTGMDRRKL